MTTDDDPPATAGPPGTAGGPATAPGAAEDTVVTLMWEARAPRGRGADLLAWVRAQPLAPEGPPGGAGGPAAAAVRPLRRETLAADQDRVLVITWWNAPYDARVPELPDPPAGLTGRPVHRWRFRSVDVA